MPEKGRSGKFSAINDYLIRGMLESPYYRIQEDGRIFTCIERTGKVSTRGFWREAGSRRHHGGYAYVSFTGVKLAVHRIIYQKFIGELKHDLVVNHKDGNGLNNAVSNLELVPVAANNFHRFRDLKHAAVYGNAKLNFGVAEEIRRLHKKGYTYTHLSLKFGVSKGHISQIVNYKIWTQPNPQETQNEKTI